jgi:DNA-binding CsgD family transcriptional regulator
MNYFDLLREFIHIAERATTIDELAAAFETAIVTLGFRYFACCAHVDPLMPPPGAVVMHSYPTAWVREVSEQKLFQIDPMFQRAEQSLLPFFWDADDFRAGLTRQQREMLAQAAGSGIAHGYTVPLHLPASRAAYSASCSVVPDSLALEPARYHIVQLMAYHLYDAAVRASKQGEDGMIELSNRERQCLELVAQGKSDWVVGKLLGISERTVHNHIERAKRRLGVTTRVQAIVHALATRQISFGDVIKAEMPRTHVGWMSTRDRSGS